MTAEWVRSHNEAAFRSMGAAAAELSGQGLDGGGIAIGLVDYGFDVLHPSLQERDGRTSRLRSLWDQNKPGSPGHHDGAAIGRWIQAAVASGSRASATADYDPHANYYDPHGPRGGAHGTAMASIAAGTPCNGPTGLGLATASRLYAVQLGLLDPGWKEVDASGRPTWLDWPVCAGRPFEGWRSYDAAPCLVAALDHLAEAAAAAGEAMLIVNLSIGAWAGAHDGASAVELKIAELIERGQRGPGPVIAVVACAGNAGADEGHFEAELPAGGERAFAWHMGTGDPTPNKLEIWYRATHPLAVELVPPGGALSALKIESDTTVPLELAGRRIGIADHRRHVRGDLAAVRFVIHPPLIAAGAPPEGSGEIAWSLRCRAPADVGCRLHAWLERDDGIVERSWLEPSQPGSTLSCLAAAAGAIVVAGYDHHVHDDAGAGRFPPSSIGPLPWADGPRAEVPHLAAPAHRIRGACSGADGFTETSGTSAAAALASGALAVVAGAALRRAAANGEAPRRRLLAAVEAFRRNGLGEGERRWSPVLGSGPIQLGRILREVTA
jgi:hypothetical protein